VPDGEEVDGFAVGLERKRREWVENDKAKHLQKGPQPPGIQGEQGEGPTAAGKSGKGTAGSTALLCISLSPYLLIS